MDPDERAVATVPEGPRGTRQGEGGGGAETHPSFLAAGSEGVQTCGHHGGRSPGTGDRRRTALSQKLTWPGAPRRLPGDTRNDAQLSPRADDLLMHRVLGRPGERTAQHPAGRAAGDHHWAAGHAWLALPSPGLKVTL